MSIKIIYLSIYLDKEEAIIIMSHICIMTIPYEATKSISVIIIIVVFANSCIMIVITSGTLK